MSAARSDDGRRELVIRLPRLPGLPGARRGGEAGPAGAPPREPLAWGWLALAATFAVLAVVAAVVLHGRADDARATTRAQDEALAAVAERVPPMFTYTSATLDDDLKTALAQTTGSFSEDYAAVLDQVVRPAATQRDITTTATLTASGVVSAAPRQVVVLAFLTQSTRAGTDAPTVTGSRIEVTLRPVDGRWLVAGIETV